MQGPDFSPLSQTDWDVGSPAELSDDNDLASLGLEEDTANESDDGVHLLKEVRIYVHIPPFHILISIFRIHV